MYYRGTTEVLSMESGQRVGPLVDDFLLKPPRCGGTPGLL